MAQVKTWCNVVQDTPDNNSQEKTLFNVVLILLGQHGTGKNLVQCCPTGSGQHFTEKYSVVLKTLYNVVLEGPYNIAEGKILFNIVLILLGQYCTGKSLKQCCPRRSRQHCTRKILFSVVLILLGQHCMRKIPSALFSK